MLHLPELSAADRENEAKLTAWGAQLETALNARQPAGRHYSVTLQPGTTPHLVVSRTEHSVTVEKHLHREFFSSSEYRRITELSRTLVGLFGAGATSSADPSQSPTLAHTGTAGGLIPSTAAYTAPEQYRGGTVDGRADQFSFCVAVWEALYGQRPFAGDNLHALMFAISQAAIVEPPSERDVRGRRRAPRRCRTRPRLRRPTPPPPPA